MLSLSFGLNQKKQKFKAEKVLRLRPFKNTLRPGDLLRQAPELPGLRSVFNAASTVKPFRPVSRFEDDFAYKSGFILIHLNSNEQQIKNENRSTEFNFD